MYVLLLIHNWNQVQTKKKCTYFLQIYLSLKNRHELNILIFRTHYYEIRVEIFIINQYNYLVIVILVLSIPK